MCIDLQPRLQAASFDAVAASYDELFTESFVGKAQRNLVWREMDQLFQPGQRILEINCGTGVDAAHLAQRGVRVFACDASSAMIHVARQRAARLGLTDTLEFHTASIEGIGQLHAETPFDGLLSNFAGLNCVRCIETALYGLMRLLKPGAHALLCVFGKYCAWEAIWNLTHGNPRKAFRRLRTISDGHLTGSRKIDVRYWSVRQLRHYFSPYFRLERRIGLGISVPPSYLESLACRFPVLFRAAEKVDAAGSSLPGFRSLGDHVLLTFERL